MTALTSQAGGAEAAEPPAFSPRVVLILVVVGVLAAIGFGVVATFAPDLRTESDGGAHALSKSAVGYAGLIELLRDRGAPVVVSRGLPPGPAQTRGLLVLTPGAGAPRVKIETLAKRYAHVLLVMPKWLAARDLSHPGWVRRFGLIPAEPLLQMLPPEVHPGLRRQRASARPRLLAVFGPLLGDAYPVGDIRALQTVLLDGDVWVRAPDGSGVVSNPRRGFVTVLSDPDLLNNHGLASLETTRFAVALIDGMREGGPVVFDVTLNGYERARSLWKLLLTPPFLGATLCALAAALLMGGHAAARFGPTLRPERAIAPGGAALADNAAALIALARREPAMAPRYAALTRRAIARAVALQRGLTPAQEDAALDRLSAPGQAPLSELLAQADRVGSVEDLRRLSQRLYERRMEMTRERR